MPFSAQGLAALTQADGFTLWLYRTDDPRAAVLGEGYLDRGADRLMPGDLVIVQAADAVALVPIRAGAQVGDALTLDSAGAAPVLARGATQRFAVAQTATTSLRGIALGDLPALPVTGEPLPVTASVSGAIAAVVFTLRDAADAVVEGPLTAPVLAGVAVAAFTAPAPGNGYRIRAEATGDATIFALSPAFFVGSLPRLLRESGGVLLTEAGGSLLL